MVLSTYMRRCRRCGEYYASRFKKGKICDECRLPLGSGTIEVEREQKRKELIQNDMGYGLNRRR